MIKTVNTVNTDNTEMSDETLLSSFSTLPPALAERVNKQPEYVNICHGLGLDPGALRAGLKRWRAEQESPAVQPAA